MHAVCLQVWNTYQIFKLSGCVPRHAEQKELTGLAFHAYLPASWHADGICTSVVFTSYAIGLFVGIPRSQRACTSVRISNHLIREVWNGEHREATSGTVETRCSSTGLGAPKLHQELFGQ